MSHFAQYRHRGGHITGFIVGPPVLADFTPTISTTHVNVAVGAGPGGGVTSALAETYRVATPSIISETFVVSLSGNATGAFAYGGEVVGIRIRWMGGTPTQPASPWGPEKTLTFP